MTETALAWYVYCVVPAGAPPMADGPSGVDPSFEVGRLTHRGLSAIVSRVPLEEYGSEALGRHLEDLDWVARTARAHNAVITGAMAAEAVVPFRICTIFADETGLRDALEREREVLLDALSRLRGQGEWSVKAMTDPGASQATARERGSAVAGDETAMSGRDFFARKRLERVARDQARATVESAVEDAHARLCRQAAAAIRLPVQDRRLSGRPGEMVLNGAYLVERSNADAFAALVDDLDAQHREIGLALELSGPFAPYNFVRAGERWG
jgi:Gas vesicle synthesis protein GvpL/GvpF